MVDVLSRRGTDVQEASQPASCRQSIPEMLRPTARPTENEERELQAIAGRLGWIVVKVYRDQGISGSPRAQPSVVRLGVGQRQRSERPANAGHRLVRQTIALPPSAVEAAPFFQRGAPSRVADCCHGPMSNRYLHHGLQPLVRSANSPRHLGPMILSSAFCAPGPSRAWPLSSPAGGRYPCRSSSSVPA